MTLDVELSIPGFAGLVHARELVVTKRRFLLVASIGAGLAFWVLHQLRQIAVDPFVGEAVLEERTHDTHVSIRSLVAHLPCSAELPHIDGTPLFDPDIAFVCGIGGQFGHEEVILP